MEVYVVECTDWDESIIYGIYDDEKNAKKARKAAEKEYPDHSCTITPCEVSTTAPVVKTDFSDITCGKDKFKMEGSDHIFILAEISVKDSNYDEALVDLTDGIIYKIENVERGETSFKFYESVIEKNWMVELFFEED